MAGSKDESRKSPRRHDPEGQERRTDDSKCHDRERKRRDRESRHRRDRERERESDRKRDDSKRKEREREPDRKRNDRERVDDEHKPNERERKRKDREMKDDGEQKKLRRHCHQPRNEATHAEESKVLQLHSMFDKSAEVDEEFYLNIEDEIRMECARNRSVLHELHVHRNSGSVILKCDSIASAKEAMELFEGRSRDGRVINCMFMDIKLDPDKGLARQAMRHAWA